MAFHFEEECRPLQNFIRARPLELSGGIGQDIEPSKGQPALVLSIMTAPRVPWEPLGLLEKKSRKRQRNSITIDPESAPFPEAGWDKAFGHLMGYSTREEVRQQIVFTTRVSREAPAKADYPC